MKSKLVLSLVALCVCIVSGSDFAFGQKLYPVQGPLTAQTPRRYFPARSRISSLRTAPDREYDW